MLRAVVDPNVFIAAVITPDGVPARVVRGALARQFDLAVSPLLVREISDVLDRPKLRRYIDHHRAQALVDGILIET